MEAVFGARGHVVWWQECARAAVVFAYGLTLVRIAGRRVFGRWAALDIVVAIVVGSNLSRALTGSAPLPGTLAATTLLMALHRVLAHAAARSPRLSELVEAPAVELARNGRPEPATLVREAIRQGDLGEALRQAGGERADEARLITLEPSGKITVLKGRLARPADLAPAGTLPAYARVRDRQRCPHRPAASVLAPARVSSPAGGAARRYR